MILPPEGGSYLVQAEATWHRRKLPNRRGQRDAGADFDFSGLDRHRGLRGLAAHRHHGHWPRPLHHVALLFDANHAIDADARAARSVIGPLPRILHGEAQRFAFGPFTILQIESHAADARRTTADRRA